MSDPNEPSAEQVEVLRGLGLVVFDVDGTLTDGRVVYGDQGETQHFCVRDGQGLVWLQRHGVAVSWITGRGCAATERRARELGVEELHMASGPKAEVLRGVQARLGVEPRATLVMGDDLPDLVMGQEAAFFAAPADARAEVRARADWISGSPAGHGAARELCELILRAKGLWHDLVASYGAPAR